MKTIAIRFTLMVLLALLSIRFAISPLLDDYFIKVLNNQIDEYVVSLIKGPYFLVMESLDSIPENQIPKKVETIKKEFGYPVSLEKISSLDLLPSEIKKLENGKILSLDEWSVFYKKIANTDLLFKMGPIKDFEDTIILWKFRILNWVTLICFISLFSLMWTFPFWKNLKKIMKAASLFGNGHFETKVHLGKRSSLAPLEQAFNIMADKIRNLVESQKLLVNAASHELRTPIARIKFGLEILNSAKNMSAVKRYSMGISEDVEDLENLVSELLTYAVFDKSKNSIEMSLISTSKWFKVFMEKMDPLMGNKKISLDIKYAPENFMADTKLLGRALENLVLNAAKYADNNVEIKAEAHKGSINISVIDDGPGIPEDKHESIFEPFTRLDESRSRTSGGYGLGLAIVKQIMEGHGGTAFSRRNNKKGACMVITWPLSFK